MVYGVYGHPGPFWQRGIRLGDLGINAVFVHNGDIDQQTIERTRAEGCRIFAEFATLNGQYGDYVANHPEAHPIDETGQRALQHHKIVAVVDQSVPAPGQRRPIELGLIEKLAALIPPPRLNLPPR